MTGDPAGLPGQWTSATWLERSAISGNMRGYDEIATKYAERWTGHEQKDVLDRFKAFLPPRSGQDRVLDAACGSGVYLTALSSLYPFYIGLDISTGMLRAAARLRDLKFPAGGQRINFTHGDTAMLPFRDESFSAVWYSAGLVHSPPSQLVITITGMSRVLKPGGVFYLSYQVGTGSEIRPEGRIFFYYQSEEIDTVIACAGLTPLAAWSDISTRSTTLRSEAKAWDHVIARRAGLHSHDVT